MVFHESAHLVRMFPCLAGISDNFAGYVNREGAWADAAGAVRVLASLCSEAGVSFITGARGTVRSLRTSDSRVVGVDVVSGPPLSASEVILATGAWTAADPAAEREARGMLQSRPARAPGIA